MYENIKVKNTRCLLNFIFMSYYQIFRGGFEFYIMIVESPVVDLSFMS